MRAFGKTVWTSSSSRSVPTPSNAVSGIAAAVAVLGDVAFEVAVVAFELVVRGVEDEGDVAFVAAFRVPALEAEDPRREAAPVQEEDRLPAVGHRLLDRRAHRAGQDQLATARILLLLLAEVDDLDRRAAAAPRRDAEARGA